MVTEFPFTLPRGYSDEHGQVHRDGVMRLSTAYDEIAPMKDPRVQTNPAYLVIILLSRVIKKLGDLTHINPKTIENLYSGDLAYLQDLYRQINETGHTRLGVTCPHCQQPFEVETAQAGGTVGYPLDTLYEEVAFIGYYMHWPPESILELEHAERRRWVAEVSRINKQLNERERRGSFMAVGDRKDPLLGYNFAVEIEGVVAGGFSEVTGLGAEIETQDYREGGVNEYVHRRAGPLKYPGNIVLKKGLVDSRALWDWCWEVFRGTVTRRNLSIILLDTAGEEKLRWNFEGAYPIKWSGPELKGHGNEVAMESVELAHRGLAK